VPAAGGRAQPSSSAVLTAFPSPSTVNGQRRRLLRRRRGQVRCHGQEDLETRMVAGVQLLAITVGQGNQVDQDQAYQTEHVESPEDPTNHIYQKRANQRLFFDT